MESIEVTELTEELVKSWMPTRPADGHKGTFGKVCIIGGCEGFTGAPVFASKAAVRGGTGLVFLQVPRSVYPIVAVNCAEAMPAPLDDEGGKFARSAKNAMLERLNSCDAGLIGIGMGRSTALDALVPELITAYKKPLVLDADGLNALSAHIIALREREGVTILTPHDGEYARLAGHFPQVDRVQEAQSFAREHGCILVLKGHRTLIADHKGTVYRNTTGNAGMAKGGSGDVLAGLIVSLLAQGIEPVKATAAAVWIHGRAGDLCAESLGQRAMTPSDILDRLAEVLKPLE